MCFCYREEARGDVASVGNYERIELGTSDRFALYPDMFHLYRLPILRGNALCKCESRQPSPQWLVKARP